MESLVEFTLLTWNVLAFAGHPSGTFVTQPNIVAESLKFLVELKPDIVALQEAPDVGVFKQLKAGTQSVWPHAWFFNARWSGNKDYPHGFPGVQFSKFASVAREDLVKTKCDQLESAVFQRHWGRTLFAMPNGLTVWLVQTHLCADFGGRNNTSVRLQEVRLLLEDLNTLDSTVPVIVCGDLNFFPESEPYRLILDAGFQDTCRDPSSFPTVPVPGPAYKIDAIFHRGPGLICEEFSRPMLKQDQKGQWLSDHYPIMARFSLQEVG